MSSRERNIGQVLQGMEEYGSLYVPSKYEGKEICGFTFNPGLFRFWASKNFEVLLGTFGFQGVKDYVAGTGNSYTLNRTSIEAVESGRAEFSNYRCVAAVMQLLFPFVFYYKFRDANWRDKKDQEALRAFVLEKDQTGEIPTKCFYNCFSWKKAIGIVGRELRRLSCHFEEEDVREEFLSFYNKEVVTALVAGIEENSELDGTRAMEIKLLRKALEEENSAENFRQIGNKLTSLVEDKVFQGVCSSLDIRGVRLPDEFVYAFVGTGLFALTRSRIAFEGKTFEGLGSTESFLAAKVQMLGKTFDEMWDVYNKLK